MTPLLAIGLICTGFYYRQIHAIVGRYGKIRCSHVPTGQFPSHFFGGTPSGSHYQDGIGCTTVHPYFASGFYEFQFVSHSLQPSAGLPCYLSKRDKIMKDKKVLFVVTSHGELGNTGRKTGFWLSEVCHPYSVLSKEYEIDFVSPKGGRPPVDGFDLSDPINKECWESPEWQERISTTMTPDQVDASQYCAIFYAGGHGAMWDFPTNKEIASIAATIYEADGYVAAVCHGPAGLLPINLSNGEPLIKGKRLDGFTNAEEKANGTTEVVPFLLQTALEARHGKVDTASVWADHVVTDGRLITGQNPQSALTLGQTLLKALQDS